MHYALSLSSWENQTFCALDPVSTVVFEAMTKIDVILLSSPFTCFFLGFLSYFTLSSLYVLLGMPLPDPVFNHLSSVYDLLGLNLLAFLGFQVEVAPLSDEMVDGDRALHFGLSSDLLSANYYALGIVLLNIAVFEALLALRRVVPKASALRRILDFERREIYFGFVVSLMVGMVLPWKYVAADRFPNLSTKANVAAQFLCYALFASYLFAHFVTSFKVDPRGPTKEPTKRRKREIEIKVRFPKKAKGKRRAKAAPN